jgi:hypothetical protein
MNDGLLGVGAATLSKSELMIMLSRLQENHYKIVGRCVELLSECDLGGGLNIINVEKQAAARLAEMDPGFFEMPEPKRKKSVRPGCQCRSKEGAMSCVSGRCSCVAEGQRCGIKCRCGLGSCKNLPKQSWDDGTAPPLVHSCPHTHISSWLLAFSLTSLLLQNELLEDEIVGPLRGGSKSLVALDQFCTPAGASDIADICVNYYYDACFLARQLQACRDADRGSSGIGAAGGVVVGALLTGVIGRYPAFATFIAVTAIAVAFSPSTLQECIHVTLTGVSDALWDYMQSK